MGTEELQPGQDLLALYDEALPQVYGYLLHRCGDIALAEDLTADVFVAAARTLLDEGRVEVSVGWLVTVARNKLVDHWRRRAREERGLFRARLELASHAVPEAVSDVEGRALEALGGLPPHYRAALVLRHVDGLSVPQVAAELGRTVEAAEAVLTRARRSFRELYETVGDEQH